MSYCRWSSDNFRSDLYVYESTSGWEVHVAGRRHAWPRPPEMLWPCVRFCNRHDIDYDGKLGRGLFTLAVLWNHLIRDPIFKITPMCDIKLPHAGESSTFAEPGACALHIRRLRALGYHVPDGVEEALEDEQKALDAKPEAWDGVPQARDL